MTRASRLFRFYLLAAFFVHLLGACVVVDESGALNDASDAGLAQDGQNGSDHDAWHRDGDAEGLLDWLGLREREPPVGPPPAIALKANALDATDAADEDSADSGDKNIFIDDDDSLPELSGDAMRVFLDHIKLEELEQGFQLLFPCTDDSLADSRYNYRLSVQQSSRCDINVRSARKSIEFEPELDWKFASTGKSGLIIADFKRQKYTVRIKAGLRTEDGGELREDIEKEFTVPELSPQIRFASAGRYMPRGAWQEFEFSHRNIEEATLQVRRVPGQNLAFWMGGKQKSVDERAGDLILKEKIKVEKVTDKTLTTKLPLMRLLGTPKPGLYELTLSADKEAEKIQAQIQLVATDIQVIAKRNQQEHREQVDVWAIDSQTLAPFRGAQVRALLKSGTAVATCTTNAAGYCRLKVDTGAQGDDPELLKARTPFALQVTQGADATYLDYATLRTKLAYGETHGKPYESEYAYQSAVWSDRDLYRPKDTLHAVATLRDDAFKSAGANIPVEWVLFDPRGQIVIREQQQTNEGGLASLDYELHETAMTGQWRAELRVAKTAIATLKFGVEEFMPERLRVEASPVKDALDAAAPFEADVHARYLFGGSAQGSQVSMQCNQKEHIFRPDKHAEYTYHRLPPGEVKTREDERSLPPSVEAISTSIDANDRARLRCDFGDSHALYDGTTRIQAELQVEEAGSGRVSRALAHAIRHPESFYVGLKTDTESLSPQNVVEIDGILVDWAGELSDEVDEVDLEVIQIYRTWRYDGYRGKSVDHELLEEAKRVPLKSSRFSYRFTPKQYYYDYIIRARAGQTWAELKIPSSGYMPWHFRPTAQHQPINSTPSSLKLISDGEVSVGKTHQVAFEAPFKGRALMTVEADQVLKHAWIDVKPGQNTWRFKVDTQVPNIYVSAMLIKPPNAGPTGSSDVENSAHSNPGFTPERAFGALSIPMSRERFGEKLTIDAPEIMRPGEKLEINLSAPKRAAGSFVAVAAVDEGILSLSDYKSPDPLSDLLSRRALGVSTYDTIGSTLQLANYNPTSRAGGGDDEYDEPEMSSRIMPFKPVALWSGLKKLPKDGKTSVSFDVPLYQGELRLMAVLITPERIGRAEAAVKVRDPIVVQPSFPRFLIHADQVEIPVFLTNTTAFPQDITVDLEAENLPELGLIPHPGEARNIELLDGNTRSVSLKPGQSRAVVFKVEALRSGGAASLTVHARTNSPDDKSLHSRAQGTVPFRPAGPLERRVETMLVSTQSVDLKELLGGWQEDSENSTIRLSTNPYNGAFEHLSALVRYPYGCLEQTISQLRPMIYLPELVRSVDAQSVANSNGIDKMIEAGIKRVLSMQTPSGGFGFWSGDGEAHRWGTPYALYLLMDASRRDYAVPQERIDRALDWLEKDIRAQERNGYGKSFYYNDRYSPGFGHYVLALAGRANQAKIRDAILAAPENPRGETLERLYLLKAALYLTGDRSYADDLKALKIDTPQTSTSNPYSYYSRLRRDALLLNIFVDLFGADQNGAKIADQLGKKFSETVPTRYLYSTQEMGWGLTALGKWFKSSELLKNTPTLVANGKKIRPGTTLIDGDADSIEPHWNIARASEYDSLTLDFDELGDQPIYAVVSSEGVRAESPVEAGGKDMEVSRTFVSTSGAPLSDSVQLGDVVYMRIKLKSTHARALENIALVARIPAGMEIENPRLSAEFTPSWANKASVWNTDHVNMRDDRVEAFGSLRSGQEIEVNIALRATLAGKFHAPTVEVEGMYDTDIWARANSQELEIKHDWTPMID